MKVRKFIKLLDKRNVMHVRYSDLPADIGARKTFPIEYTDNSVLDAQVKEVQIEIANGGTVNVILTIEEYADKKDGENKDVSTLLE